MIEMVDDFFNNATDADLDEILRQVHERVSALDLEMWDGSDDDFFPLPDDAQCTAPRVRFSGLCPVFQARPNP